MKFIINMKHFSVYLPQDNKLEQAIFITEEFSFKAFLFSLIWALYNKLYCVSFVILSLVMLVSVLLYNECVLSAVVVKISCCIPLFCGVNASMWLQNSLLKKNFDFVGIVIAKNITEAQMKFFSEYSGFEKKTEVNAVW